MRAPAHVLMVLHGSAFGVLALRCFQVFLFKFLRCFLLLHRDHVGRTFFSLRRVVFFVSSLCLLGTCCCSFFRDLHESVMVLPLSTNSLAAGFVSTACTSSPSSSAALVVVTAGTSSLLSDEIALAVATALGNSLPTIIAAIRDNSTPVSSTPPAVLSVSSSAAMVVAGSYAASSGTLRLPSFVSTFPPVPAISGSSSACLADSFSSPVMSAHASILSGLESSFVPPSLEKAFVVGLGHAPIPAKLVSKITSGQFVALVDLLSAVDNPNGSSFSKSGMVGIRSGLS